jgi:hypothetical protein
MILKKTTPDYQKNSNFKFGFRSAADPAAEPEAIPVHVLMLTTFYLVS